MNIHDDEVFVELQDCCFYIRYRGKHYPLSLLPQYFSDGKRICICSYPDCKFFKIHAEQRIDYFDDECVQLSYERVITSGMFYPRPYEREELWLKDLYISCESLDKLIEFIKRVNPPINLLTALIYCTKMTSKTWIYNILAEAIAISLKRAIDDNILRSSLITYVPRHRGDMKEDIFNVNIRFNQAEILARRLASKLGLRVIDVVEKIMPDRGSPKSRKERLERARRVYKLKDDVVNLITNANIILVDDVRTTGATSVHISQLLRNGGASRIYVAVAARSVFDEDYDRFYGIERQRCGVVS